MKHLYCNTYFWRLRKNRIKETYAYLCNNAIIGENYGGYLFGEESGESFVWVEKYNDNYNAFRKDIKKIEEKYETIRKISLAKICNVRKNNLYYHINESDTSFHRMTFYRILTINNEKYLRMEFMTFPGYIADDGFRKIKYAEFSQEIIIMNSKAYLKHIVERKNPLITTENKNEQMLKINQLKLKNLLKGDFYNKISSKFIERDITTHCSESEAFYFCDAMVNNNNVGRIELNLFDVTMDTEDGAYFCFGFNKKYKYKPNNIKSIENDFEYHLIDYFGNKFIERDNESFEDDNTIGEDEYFFDEDDYYTYLLDSYLSPLSP